MNKQAKTSKLTHAASIILIAVAVVGLFWRVFFLGETLIDVRTLENQLPWGNSGGAATYPYNRRDLTDMYVTREYFVVDAYRDGEMPLWNPYTMAGHPIYADGVTRTLSPFLLFYTFLDVPLGYSVARIVELMLGASFMYIFLVRIGAGPRGGLFGSLVFGFSSHSMFHLTGLGWWGGLMWLPLIMLLVDRAITNDSYRAAAMAGFFLALQFFCGYQPNQIYYVSAIALYYLYFAVRQCKQSRDPDVLKRRAKQLAITMITGFALSATQWVPIVELLRYSNRRIVPTEMSYIYLPPWYIGTLVFPELFGSAYDVRALRLFTALNVSHDHILYVGIAALTAIAFGLYAVKEHDGQIAARIRFFGLLAMLALVVMMTAPLYVHITRFLPVLQTIRVIVRAGVLLLFAASILAGLGVQRLLEADAAVLRKFYRYVRTFLMVAVSSVAAAAAASYALTFTGLSVDESARGAAAFAKRAVVLLSEQFLPPGPAILIPLLLIAVIVLLLRKMALRAVSARTAFIALGILLAVDLWWNAAGYNPSFDPTSVFPPTKTTELLRSLPPGRVLVAPAGLETNRRPDLVEGGNMIIAPPNTLLPYRISTVTGKDQLYPRWYRDYCTLIEPQPNLSHVVFDEVSSLFLDLLNVRYVLTHAESRPPPDSVLLFRAEGVAVYENKLAMPRAFLVNRVIRVSEREDALALMKNPEFDPKTTAVISGDADPLPQFEQEPARGSTAITVDKRNRIDVDVDTSTPAFLILSDTFYPGWQASVDGVAATVIRSNHTMRGVKVPVGHHVVSFVFAPRSLRISFYAGVGALVVLIMALAASRLVRVGKP